MLDARRRRGRRGEHRDRPRGFVLAIVSLSLGECIYDSVQGPLTAALAPEQASGRHMAANSFSWQLGFIVGRASAA